MRSGEHEPSHSRVSRATPHTSMPGRPTSMTGASKVRARRGAFAVALKSRYAVSPSMRSRAFSISFSTAARARCKVSLAGYTA